MVWFDCECGESLKKPSVLKHFMSRACRRITCVDCNTAFDRDSYTAHTKCISEAQKYQGSLYQATAKQEGAKQDRWLDNLTAAVASYQGPLKQALARLLTYQNVPRKEKPFLAFCANSLGVRDASKAAAIWDLIKPKVWTGWAGELDIILKENSGSLPWKQLRNLAVAKFKEFHPHANMKDQLLKYTALAHVKDQWIKDSTTNVVSL